jgi:hypothetical protein
MDPSDDSSNQFRRDFLPSINDPLLAQRSVVNGDAREDRLPLLLLRLRLRLCRRRTPTMWSSAKAMM